MLHGMGIQTGIDMDALLDATEYVTGVLGLKNNSRAAEALLKKR